MDKFVVSARKYRPDNFKSVVGQEHITSTLVNAIARNQLSHAYLFCGPRGVGKTTCARIIAKAINCLNPTPEHEACGVCDSCRAFSENASFNIYELDAASNNSVDNIRALTEQVRIPPQIGNYSIYIIDEVHMLTTAAFNAFLKTLEEPPKYVIFILATTEKHKILPTILSRCQVYEFKHISAADVVGYLKYISANEGVTYDEESLNIIASKADGCMRDALSMYDKVVTFCSSELTVKNVSAALNILDYDTYFSFLDTLSRGEYKTAMTAFDDVLRRGFDSITFLAGLARHVRDVLMANNPATVQLLGVGDGLVARYTTQARACSVGFLFTTLDIIGQTESTIRYSLNQRLTAELAILRICDTAAPLCSKQLTETPTVALHQTPAKTEAVTPVPTVVVTESVPAVAPVVAPAVAPVVAPVVAPAVAPIVAEPTAKVEVTPAIPAVPATPVVKQENEVNDTKAAVKRSMGLGLPRLSSLQTQVAEAEKEAGDEAKKKEQDEYNSSTYTVGEEEQEKVLAACTNFASRIKARNPRVALAFEEARVTEGTLIIPVPNKILADEIHAKKIQSCEYLSKIAGFKILNFTVVIEQVEIEKKKILLRDEDKYAFLLEKNKNLHTLTEKLGLDFM